MRTLPFDMNSRSEEILDAKTEALLNEWLAAVLPHMADECAEAIEEDAVDKLLNARAEGLTPEEAIKRLPNKFWLRLPFQHSYLRTKDMKMLAEIRNQLRYVDPERLRSQYVLISIAILVGIGSIVYAVLRPSLIPYVPSIFLVTTFVILICAIQPLRRKAIETMGPIGSGIVSFDAWGFLLGSLMALHLIGTDLVGFGGRFPMSIYFLLIITFFASMPTYVAFIRRVQNNREIVGRILGLPGYGDEDVLATESTELTEDDSA